MLIDQLKKQPLFQIIWSLLILMGLLIIFQFSDHIKLSGFTPFLGENAIDLDQLWLRVLFLLMNFSLLFSSLFRLSSLLRNFHFTGDSRFEMLFLLLTVLLLFPDLLFHLEYGIFVYFLQRSLSLQFNIHTQLKVNREMSLIALNMSIASLFFPYALVVALALYLGILNQRGFYLKEFLIYLISITLPFYFIASLLFLFDLPFLYHFDFNYELIKIEEIRIEELALLAFAFLFSLFLFKNISINSKAVLRSKDQFRNFYYLLLLGLLICLLTNSNEGLPIMLLSLFAIFSSSILEMRRYWIYEMALILITGLSISTYLIAS